MRETIRLGRFAGVRVGLHWSVLGIVVVLTAGLGAYWLPAALPGHAPVGYAISGLVAAALLVCSVLVHELAHSIVARRNGVGVEGITLWLLGGVARLRGEARTAGADFRIAVVGPLSSAGLALLFGAAAWTSANLGAGELITVVLGYSAALNVVLAVFNLVPAAPLDGGRVLRAVLWALSGDRFRAAMWSAWAGRGFGFLLIVAGIAEALGRSVGGLWLVLVGLFIVHAASAEERFARVGLSLAGIKVGDVMSSPVETMPANRTVEHFTREIVASQRHSAYPVLGADGELLGLVTVKDVRAVPMTARGTTRLHEVACAVERIAMAEEGEPLALVLSRVTGDGGGRILVWSGRELRGIIAPSDLARVLSDHGLTAVLPAGADLTWEPDSRPPPAGWWYPGAGGPGDRSR
jgi:Zn-dependent protease